MKFFSTIIPMLVVLLLSDPAIPTYAGPLNVNVLDKNLYNWLDEGNTQIGFYPRVDFEIVDVNGVPVYDVKMCGQWYQDGAEANAPNSDIVMGVYCRQTDEQGNTFFAMHYKGLEYTGSNIQFKVTELSKGSTVVYPNQFISMSF